MNCTQEMIDTALKEDPEFNESIINFFIKNTRKLEQSEINKIYILINEFVGGFPKNELETEEKPELETEEQPEQTKPYEFQERDNYIVKLYFKARAKQAKLTEEIGEDNLLALQVCDWIIAFVGDPPQTNEQQDPENT